MGYLVSEKGFDNSGDGLSEAQNISEPNVSDRYPIAMQVSYWNRELKRENISPTLKRYSRYLRKSDILELKKQGDILTQATQDSIRTAIGLSNQPECRVIYRNLSALFQAVRRSVTLDSLYAFEGQVGSFTSHVLENAFSSIVFNMFKDFDDETNKSRRVFYEDSSALLTLSREYGFKDEVRNAVVFELRHISHNISFGGDSTNSIGSQHPFVAFIQDFVRDVYASTSLIHDKTVGHRFEERDIRNKMSNLEDCRNQIQLFKDVFDIDDSIPDIPGMNFLRMTLNQGIDTALTRISENILALQRYCSIRGL